jgi:hypothetical protein
MNQDHRDLAYLLLVQTFGIIAALVYLHQSVRALGRYLSASLERIEQTLQAIRGDQSHD